MVMNLLAAFALIFAVGAVWFLLHYYGNPVIDNPQGLAKVAGNCGDTMEIGLQIENNVVSSAHS